MTREHHAVLWSLPECALCASVEAALLGSGHVVEVRPASELTAGRDANTDAMAQLALQDMAAPVVWIHGRGFVEPRQILDTEKE